MAKNRIQFQQGLSLREFLSQFGTDETQWYTRVWQNESGDLLFVFFAVNSQRIKIGTALAESKNPNGEILDGSKTEMT